MTIGHEELVEEALARINGLMSYRRRALCAQPLHREVSLPQLHILMMLQEQGRMTVSELANALCVSAPSASSIVDRMERLRLVERARDAADRRVVCVEISDHGRRVVEEMAGVRRDQLQALFRTMTDGELRHVICGVEAVQRALARLHQSEEDEELFERSGSSSS
jgi:DNA-binding MarR family transcriptional regulator